MTDQHCPGFEANKSITEVTVKCPECGQKKEIFSDEMDKKVTCSGCGKAFDPMQNKAE
jgi:ribosomal protein S27E